MTLDWIGRKVVLIGIGETTALKTICVWVSIVAMSFWFVFMLKLTWGKILRTAWILPWLKWLEPTRTWYVPNVRWTTQWAAVKIHRFAIIDPPQKWSPQLVCNEAMYGNWPGAASWPPTSIGSMSCVSLLGSTTNIVFIKISFYKIHFITLTVCVAKCNDGN